MDRGERNPKRWRWKGITGTVWLLPSESASSVESSSRSESSEDAGWGGRERGQKGVSGADDLWPAALGMLGSALSGVGPQL